MKLSKQDLKDLRLIAINQSSRSAIAAVETQEATKRLLRHAQWDCKLIGSLDGLFYLLDDHANEVRAFHLEPLEYEDPSSVIQIP